MGYFKTLVLKQRILRSVELAVTYDCQLRCSKCFAMKWLEENRERNYMTIEQIKDMWKQAYRLGAVHINLTGGEPLLRKDICEVVKVLKPKGTLISLVTNGLLLTYEKALELKKAGLNTFQISMDSYKPELHDKYRGYKGCYDKIIQAVKNAKKAGLNVCFTTLVTHENIRGDEVPKMLELAKEYNVLLLINFAGRTGGWSKKDHLVLTKEDKKILNKYMKDPYARICEMFNFYKIPGLCLMGKDKLNISAYGDVYPCTHVMLKFGNVIKTPLKELWDRMADFKYFKDFTTDCRRCDDEEFIKKYMDPIAKSKKPMLTVEEIENGKWKNNITNQ